jgi:arylsulfatase A-like enzyme
VADSVESVQQALIDSGHADDTLVLVTSDNGFHVGSYRMHRGKRSAFDSDTVVPLVVIGPGIAKGQVVSEMTSETDLAPTLTQALGAEAPSWADGRSLWPLLPDPAAGAAVRGPWRTGVLSESLGVVQRGDPDFQLIAPPPFASLRTRTWLYVEISTGERELYDRVHDPYEIANIAATVPPGVVDALSAQLHALTACSGVACQIADSMPEP